MARKRRLETLDQNNMRTVYVEPTDCYDDDDGDAITFLKVEVPKTEENTINLLFS